MRISKKQRNKDELFYVYFSILFRTVMPFVVNAQKCVNIERNIFRKDRSVFLLDMVMYSIRVRQNELPFEYEFCK
jgi:hypothetical protein